MARRGWAEPCGPGLQGHHCSIDRASGLVEAGHPPGEAVWPHPRCSSPARGANHPVTTSSHTNACSCSDVFMMAGGCQSRFLQFASPTGLDWTKCNRGPRMRWPSYLIIPSYSREMSKCLLLVTFDDRRKHFKTTLYNHP